MKTFIPPTGLPADQWKELALKLTAEGYTAAHLNISDETTLLLSVRNEEPLMAHLFNHVNGAAIDVLIPRRFDNARAEFEEQLRICNLSRCRDLPILTLIYA